MIADATLIDRTKVGAMRFHVSMRGIGFGEEGEGEERECLQRKCEVLRGPDARLSACECLRCVLFIFLSPVLGMLHDRWK